jgi:hypothetical protein
LVEAVLFDLDGFGGARPRRTESEDAVVPDLLIAEKGKEKHQIQ